MKTLRCEQCDKKMGEDYCGLKFDDLYFCSQECLDEYVSWHTNLITGYDFEQDGEDGDEVVNDYDIQMGYEND